MTNRSEFVKVRVSVEEKTELKSKANQEGVSVSDLLRAGAFGVGAIRRRPAPEFAEQFRWLYRNLAQVGSNTNKMARLANTGKLNLGIHSDAIATVTAQLHEAAARALKALQ